MLIPMPATREEWLKLRHDRIGASEVAALFGVQPPSFPTEYALHHIKSGSVAEPQIEGERLTWGLLLEDAIAAGADEMKGWTVKRGRYAICDDCRLGASIDFEIECDPTGENFGPGILECKNIDWIAHERTWTADQPPPHILMQSQAQLFASGYSWGYVAGLVGGNHLELYPDTARPALHAEIKNRVDAFWRRVDGNNEPPVDGSESAAYVLRELYPEVVDDLIDLSENEAWSAAVRTFIETGAVRKEATKAYDLAKNQVVALLSGHKRGVGGGYSVSTAVIPAKPDRLAEPGEIIKGRVETRRYTAKSMGDK